MRRSPSQSLPISWCLGLLLLFAAPLIGAALLHYDGFFFANESIAYRWGHPSRVAIGDVPPILPQGFTLSTVQQVIVKAIEAIRPLSLATLHGSVQTFCWSTLLLFAAIFTGLVFTSRRRAGDPWDSLWSFAPWAIATWSTGTAGLYYALLPDYYQLNAIVAIAALLALLPFLVAVRDAAAPGPRPRHAVILGIVLGLGLANKITWIAPAIVAFAAVFIGSRGSLRLKIGFTALLATAAGAVSLMVLLAYYQFQPSRLHHGLQEWLAFMHGQQGEFALGSPAFATVIKHYNYDVLYVGQAVTLLLAVMLQHETKSRLVWAACLLAGSLLIFAASRRPAGTTFWDINVLLLICTAATALTLPSPAWRRGTLVAWLVLGAALFVREPPRLAFNRVATSRDSALNRFEVFDAVNQFAQGRPQVVLFPNNEYHHEGVHEFLLKAASDFPTWDVTVGQNWLGHVLPGMHFLHDYNQDVRLPDDFSPLCLVWFDRPELAPLEQRFAILATRSHDPNYERRDFPIYAFPIGRPKQVQVWVHALRRRESAP